MKTLSIRPFIGSKNFETSRQFYQDLGFKETVLMPNFSVFELGAIAFYLQDYYLEDWINNTMVFIEVEDLDGFWDKFSALDLPAKYETVKLVPIQDNHWGREFFVHDPSGILWHFGTFSK